MGGKNPFNHPGSKADETAGADVPLNPVGQPVASENEPPPREIETVPSSMWTVAGYLLLLTMLVLCGRSLLDQKTANDALGDELRELEQKVRQAKLATTAAEQAAAAREASLTEANETIAALNQDKAALERAKEEATSAQSALESEMRAALESKDVAISELQGKLTLNILDRILFDSGQAIIKPEGQEVLRKLAAVLDQFPDRQVHVSGHTDNIPIRTAPFPSNWELSAARALAAVRFLVEEAGVNPKRLAAVANGEFQPVADNATPEGRARNRRIAIVVLPEVFKIPEAPAETAPAPPGVPPQETPEPPPATEPVTTPDAGS